MSRGIPAIVLLVAGAALAAAYFFWPERGDDAGRLHGYVEAQALLIGPDAGGRIVQLAVSEGDEIEAGTELFALDARTETAALAEAEARLARTRSELEDLRDAQERPQEIEVLEASRSQARAALDLSRAELERQRALYARGTIAEARLDQARTAFERDRAALAEIERRIEVARLASREARIEAAAAEVDAARANVDRARTELARRNVLSPEHGRITDVFYRRGEVIGAGQPVLELLPPENLRVRFYVPEPMVSTLLIGGLVEVACDGCPPRLRGTITFISPEAEYTPPVIFSREERARLVFLVEAKPMQAAPALKPGLPVEVTPGPPR